MHWKKFAFGVLATAVILSVAMTASAKKDRKVPGYLALGDSYTYGYGADGNDNGGNPRTNEHPGFGYTDTVYDYLLDQKGNKHLEHKNLAIGGATSAQVNDRQLGPAVDFLKAHRKTIIEIASGGNDLLGFMLFPQSLPPQAIKGHLVCNMNTPYYDLAICDQVLSGIIDRVEENLRFTVDTLLDNMDKGSGIVLRTFSNAIGNGNTSSGPPAQPLPFPFSCAGPYNPQQGQFGAMDLFYSPAASAVTGYSVATNADQVEHIFYSDTETFEGLNVMIARVADEYADAGYAVVSADIGATITNGVYWDCVHPTDAGHDAIALVMIDAIEELGELKKPHCK
ncbi:MAG: GDSL-type esterase/lipase family protein [Myxococcota bacterium]|jgi:lysophospholipase L1-like esterase|nr:GDSL-type esterase/lipase family protein [Myxococcota bacterium]